MTHLLRIFKNLGKFSEILLPLLHIHFTNGIFVSQV